MFVLNNGAILHTLHGSLKPGLNEVDDKLWAEMKKSLGKHMSKPEGKDKSARVEESSAPKKGEKSATKVKPSPEAEKQAAEKDAK